MTDTLNENFIEDPKALATLGGLEKALVLHLGMKTDFPINMKVPKAQMDALGETRGLKVENSGQNVVVVALTPILDAAKIHCSLRVVPSEDGTQYEVTISDPDDDGADENPAASVRHDARR